MNREAVPPLAPEPGRLRGSLVLLGLVVLIGALGAVIWFGVR